jgi:putative membrane-bound dehydrogenase-like protein
MIAMLLRLAFCTAVVCHLVATAHALAVDDEPAGKTPEGSLKSIAVAPGFNVELVASEPLVKDPIAFEWGADGKLWVVEMGDYPLGIDGKGKPGGVVRFLEDTDGDGRYDKQTTFLESLGFPTGVIPWREGVLVACAPDIFYAVDRDGDGKADHREVLFTGFGTGNQQHRLNGFEIGMDGWLYGANGDSDGRVRSAKTGKVTSISGRDFRFRPDTGEFEAESGRTQYGRHRDDWGHWFGNNNPNWAWHYVLANHDLRRNPSFAAPDPRQTLEAATRLYPISRALPRFNDAGAANHATAANSPTPYRDDLFGPEFATSLFVSEPVHNLVHRMVLEPEGVSFRGRRAAGEEKREFLASSDNWFRPTMLKTGPDGALWIADMYRAVIEHPEWIPDDWEARLDLRAGSEQGRIYRVYPADKKPRPIPRLDTLDVPGLVAALESSSGWQRDTALRLLSHRRDPAAIDPLRALALGTKRPKTRVQAIWTLAELGGLDEPTLLAALEDPDSRVREAVIAAAWPIARLSRPVLDALIRMAEGANARVRFEAALALGNCPDRRAGEALAQLARRDGNEPWMRAAILSSAPLHIDTMLVALLRASAPRQGNPGATAALIGQLLSQAVSLKTDAPIELITRAIAEPAAEGGRFAPDQFAMLYGLLDAHDHSSTPHALDFDRRFAVVWTAARRAVSNDSAPEAERAAAAELIGYSARRNTKDRDLLVGLLRPRVSIGLQQAAVAALGTGADPKLADLLLVDWKTYSPSIRATILDTVTRRTEWTSSLLSSLEDGCVSPGDIDPARRQQLLTRGSARHKSRAQAVFAHESQPRQAIVDAFRGALDIRGDRTAGAIVFKKLCASCHRLGNEGVEVGPDLASLNDKSPEALLIAILDPNRALETKYANFSIATVDGRVLNGLIANESATAVTLRRQDGKEDVLLRSQIDTMTASGQSLMPEGLEKDLKPQDLADLIAFLGPAGSPRKAE